MNVPDRIDDPKAADFVIEPGLQTLNGEQALAFCRSRAFADGDYTRMRHQRIFIAALANTLLNKVDAANIVPITNSVSDMVVSKIWTANVPSYAGENTMINGQSYVFVYEDALEEMMDRVRAGENPQGPQTMGESGDSATVDDLSNNEASDWSNGTATTGSSEGSEEE